MSNTSYSPEVSAVLAKVAAAVEGQTYGLTFIEHGDRLSAEQCAVMVRGENPYESRLFSDLEVVMDDQRYEAAIVELKDMLTAQEFGVLDGDVDALGEARSMVQDRDTSDLVGQLFENTSSLLMRYDLGLDVEIDHHSTDAQRAAMMVEIVEHLKLEAHDPIISKLPELLHNVPYGGRLWVLWYGNPSQLVNGVLESQKARMGEQVRPATITFGKGAYLVCLDQSQGSGHDVRIEHDLSVAFDSDQLTTDEDGRGYSWTEIASPSPMAYTADVRITYTKGQTA